MVEHGKDVAILLDVSITPGAGVTTDHCAHRALGRLIRARLFRPPNGSWARRQAGGRRQPDGATVLVETGSRMDDIIFEEFKGTATWSYWTAS